ncbi:MAG: hypothetical protein AAGU14_11830 [Eubacteriaceae bacterium]
MVMDIRKILGICSIFFFLCFAILKAISIMNPNNEYYFLVGKLGGKTAEPITFALALISLCLMLILSKMGNRYKIIIIGFGLIAVMSTFILSLFLGGIDYYRYFYFNSPDKKNTIVVAEWSFLLGGGAHCYVRENPFFVRRLAGSMGTDDGYRAFSNETYQVNWLDNQTVTFKYGNGYSGVSTDTFVLDKYWGGSQK